jgi:uncharacterized protein YjlB
MQVETALFAGKALIPRGTKFPYFVYQSKLYHLGF